MIDTWLLSALLLGILALGVILRMVRIPEPDERLVAATVAVILGALTALTLSIAYGTLLILDAGIIAALLCFAAMIYAGTRQEAGA